MGRTGELTSVFQAPPSAFWGASPGVQPVPGSFQRRNRGWGESPRTDPPRGRLPAPPPPPGAELLPSQSVLGGTGPHGCALEGSGSRAGLPAQAPGKSQRRETRGKQQWC